MSQLRYPVYPSYSTQIVTVPAPRCSTAHLVIAWVLAVLTGLYLLPWAVAATRGKRNVGPIALINIFLGWTLAGWIAALVMACLNDDRPAAVVIHQPAPFYGTYPEPSGQFHAPTPLSPPRAALPPAHQSPGTAVDPYAQPYPQPSAYAGWASQPTADEPTRPIRLPSDPHGPTDPYGPRWR